MYSDTHFHFEHMNEISNNGVEILTKLSERNTFFALDIGTRANDLEKRQSCVEHSISQIKDTKLADRARNFMYFSAGIWPDVDSIHNRFKVFKELESQIQKAEISQKTDGDILHRKIIAIGECGIDHHWNPTGVDGRSQNDFDEKTYSGERELFEMQLLLAKKMNLPVIVHSRDGFEDTLNCIKNSGYDNGIIHCYSYNLEEAKKFIERGWFISFSGSVTYNKKSKLEAISELIRFVPDEKLLCETDSPYLAPVPFRGNPNNPVFVQQVYEFVANVKNISPEKLSEIVDSNIKKLFPLY